VPGAELLVLAGDIDATWAAFDRFKGWPVPVIMVAGNHDCWGGEVLTNDVGVDYRLAPWEGRIGNWSARIEHAKRSPPADRVNIPHSALRYIIDHLRGANSVERIDDRRTADAPIAKQHKTRWTLLEEERLDRLNLSQNGLMQSFRQFLQHGLELIVDISPPVGSTNPGACGRSWTPT